MTRLIKYGLLNVVIFWNCRAVGQADTLLQDTTLSGQITLMQDLIIKGNATLFIKPGTSFIMGKGVSIFAVDSARIEISGKQDSVISFKSLDEKYTWGGVTVKDTGSYLDIHFADFESGYAKIMNGAEGLIEDSYFHDYIISGVGLDKLSAIYSEHSPEITVRRCRFSNYYQVNFYYSLALIENCLFEYWIDDAIDFDNSIPGSKIRFCTLRHGVGPDKDAIDFGKLNFEGEGASGQAESCLIYDVSDKGVSVGEGAENVIVLNTVIYNATSGIAIKDNSNAVVINNTICNSVYGLLLIEKNPGLGGGHGQAYNNIIWDNTENIGLLNNSTLDASYSIIGGEPLYPGNGNLNVDPMFVDEGNHDYQLLPGSPALGAGMNGENLGATFPVGCQYTFPDYSIVIGYPNCISVLTGLSEQPIYWSAAPDIELIKIEYSSDNGAVWNLIADSIQANSGMYLWSVPNIYSTQCKIRISDTENENISKVNLANFTITSAGEEADPPLFSAESGFYSSDFNLTLMIPEGSTVYYTTDGSDPTDKSLVYSDFIEIKEQYFSGSNPEQFISAGKFPEQPLSFIRTTSPPEIGWWGTWYKPSHDIFRANVIKAIVYTPGKALSKIISKSYLVHPDIISKYQVPVLSITTDKSNLFDYLKGIYHIGANNVPAMKYGTSYYGNCAQKGFDFERPAYLDFFDPSGNLVLSQKMGIRIRGEWHRMFGQKALTLYARNEYDVENNFSFPVFPGYKRHKTDGAMKTYKRLQVRNGGTEYYTTRLRDALCQMSMVDENVKISAYEPAVVFINGEFWGLFELREVNDDRSLEKTYGLNEDSVVILEDNLDGKYQIESGTQADVDKYLSLESFIQTHDMSSASDYESVTQKMDVQSYIDQWITRIYYNNLNFDHNLVYWKNKGAQNDFYGHDGRWRWMINDFDFGLVDPDFNFMVCMIQPNSQIILNNLFVNSGFEKLFISRFCDLMNTAYKPNYLTNCLESYVQRIEPVLPQQIDRWGFPWYLSYWYDQIDTVVEFINLRPEIMSQHLEQYFGLTGTCEITLNSNSEQGHIKINSLEINQNTKGIEDTTMIYPWTGQYFKGIVTELEAIPNYGFRFEKWLETEGTDRIISIIPTTNSIAYTAVFVKDTVESDTSDFIIHYWHFNDSETDTLYSVLADSCLIANGQISYPGFSDGFMDAGDNESGSEINCHFENPSGRALKVRNPSDLRVLVLNIPTTGFKNIIVRYASQRTINGSQIQEIYYSKTEEPVWIRKSEYSVAIDTFSLYSFDFSDDTNTFNDPFFKVKIVFRGSNVSLNEGNVKFDNISVEGVPYEPWIKPTFSDSNILSVFPNPASGEVFIISKLNLSNVIISIYSPMGQMLGELKEVHLSSSNPYHINLNQSESDFLIIKVQNQDVEEYCKIIRNSSKPRK
jgi:hypothetical protein